MKKIIFILIPIFLLIGCATVPTAPTILSMEQVIIAPTQYSTEKGKALAIKHYKNLQNIFANIRSKYSPAEIDFATVKTLPDSSITGGIGFFKNDLYAEDNRYLGTIVGTSNIFNTLQTDFTARTATVFSKYARNILEIISKEQEALDDENVAGIHIHISWWARDFLVSKYYGGEVEGISIQCSQEDCEKYLKLTISNQEFVDRCVIAGWQGNNLLGKIELDLKQLL